MPRLLSIVTSRVAASDRSEYLDTVAALKQLHSGRGLNLWLFEREGQPGSFIEFSESATGTAHRGGALLESAEIELEDRLATLTRESDGHDQRWLEVALPDARKE